MDLSFINCLMIPTARCVLPTPWGPMNNNPNGWDIGNSSTNFSAAIFAFSIERSGDERISKFSSSQCAYRWGILAASSSRPERLFFTQSHRETPSEPSRETRIQPVPPHDGQEL